MSELQPAADGTALTPAVRIPEQRTVTDVPSTSDLARDPRPRADTVIDGEPVIGPPRADGTAPASSDTRSLPRQPGYDAPAPNPVPPDQVADDPQVPRWSAANLTPTGVHGRKIVKDLYLGSDGRNHFDGDRIDGTWRDRGGHLQGPEGYATDHDKAPAEDIDAPAVRGRSRPIPTDGPQPSAAAVHEAASARQAVANAKRNLWDAQVKPLLPALESAGMTVDRKTFGSEAASAELDGIAPALTRTQRVEARAASDAYGALAKDLVRASEELGAAGGAHAVAVVFPRGRLVSGGDGIRGPPGTFDRVVYVDDAVPLLVVIEEKGAGATLGTRQVRDPAGQVSIAEQCSPEYLHALLNTDPNLARAMRDDPGLRIVLQATADGSNGGEILCFAVKTSRTGRVNMIEYRLDPDRLRREAIQLPPDDERRR